VIAYHFGASINGGAGVTVFFALSGYIVTTVLLREHEQRGTIHLRGFYIRRLRRLLPASTIVVIATVLVGRAMHRPSIFRQSVASLTYWANFERYTSHYSYGATAYAPLEHYWSLAIEEQFYLLLPVVCLVMLPLG
ncbi:MAG: acyltransferase family protein, partial [Ilumatobacteraceae bacterium]